MAKPTFVKQTSTGYSKSPLVPLHARTVVILTWSFLSLDVAMYFASALALPFVSSSDIGLVRLDGKESDVRVLGKPVPS